MTEAANLRQEAAQLLKQHIPELSITEILSSLRDGYPKNWRSLSFCSSILMKLKGRSEEIISALDRSGTETPYFKIICDNKLIIFRISDFGLGCAVNDIILKFKPLKDRPAAQKSLCTEKKADLKIWEETALKFKHPRPLFKDSDPEWTYAFERLRHLFNTAGKLYIFPNGQQTCSLNQSEDPLSASLAVQLESLSYIAESLKGQNYSVLNLSTAERIEANPALQRKLKQQISNLLTSFHDWYKNVPVFGASEDTVKSRLRLAEALRYLLTFYSSEALD